MLWQDLNDNLIYDPGEPCEEYQEKKECTLVKTVGTGIACCTDDDCSLSDQYCEWYEDFKSRCVTEKEWQQLRRFAYDQSTSVSSVVRSLALESLKKKRRRS